MSAAYPFCFVHPYLSLNKYSCDSLCWERPKTNLQGATGSSRALSAAPLRIAMRSTTSMSVQNTPKEKDPRPTRIQADRGRKMICKSYRHATEWLSRVHCSRAIKPVLRCGRCPAPSKQPPLANGAEKTSLIETVTNDSGRCASVTLQQRRNHGDSTHWGNRICTA